MSFTVYKEQDMTGASATTAGKSGLVPAPEVKKHTAFLRGDGTWVEPQYVKTVNGNAPAPSGNVDVSSGSSDSSVGILRLIKTIQPESWQAVSGGYQYTVTDSKITSDMDVVEAWLTDEENAMLGATTFTCSTGVMYITTETQPTVAWSLTVILGTNGAEAMDDLSALITKVGSATLQTESQNLSAAVNELDSTDNEIESGLAAISNGDTHAQLAAGQYVYIKNHSSIAEGLYKTTAAVDANGSLVNKVESASDVLSNQSQQIDDLQGESDTRVLKPSAAFSIPASGGSVSYNLAGLTAGHELARWNFSSSAENEPPVDLSWYTYDGYFTITNTSGSTSETTQPVFVLPEVIATTVHS